VDADQLGVRGKAGFYEKPVNDLIEHRRVVKFHLQSGTLQTQRLGGAQVILDRV
jgi:hypothetical protein